MNYKKIKAAKEEVQRFLQRIKEWEKTLSPSTNSANVVHTDPDSIYNYGNKASGAIKRASLDLTRVLAELRRPV